MLLQHGQVSPTTHQTQNAFRKGQQMYILAQDPEFNPSCK
jgi:hypothetical protein